MSVIVTEYAARKIAEILGDTVTTKEHGRGRQKVKSYHFMQGDDQSVALGLHPGDAHGAFGHAGRVLPGGDVERRQPVGVMRLRAQLARQMRAHDGEYDAVAGGRRPA